MSFSSMVFLSDEMQLHVKRVHRGCREVGIVYGENCGITPTLFDILICGNAENATPQRHRRATELWKRAIKAELMPHFDSLGIYNTVVIKQKEAILKFIWNANMSENEDAYDAIFEEEPSIENLVAISKYMRSPTALLALKYFYLYLNYVDPKSYPEDAYTGAPAMTGPAQNGCKHLFKRKKIGAEAARLHEAIANEIGKSQLYVNTVLYQLGS